MTEQLSDEEKNILAGAADARYTAIDQFAALLTVYIVHRERNADRGLPDAVVDMDMAAALFKMWCPATLASVLVAAVGCVAESIGPADVVAPR